jgi:hypothetical protein
MAATRTGNGMDTIVDRYLLHSEVAVHDDHERIRRPGSGTSSAGG